MSGAKQPDVGREAAGRRNRTAGRSRDCCSLPFEYSRFANLLDNDFCMSIMPQSTFSDLALPDPEEAL
jgi:hypothetical protein